MMGEYGEKVESNPELKQTIINSVNDSLKRAGTDYFDVVHCPHATNTKEEVITRLLRDFQRIEKNREK